MCGIIGILTGRSGYYKDAVKKGLGILAHRGPDGEGCVEIENTHKNVTFGHRRLAIIDLHREGNQPMPSKDDSVHLTFNGEIYNYIELRQELEGHGVEFRTSTDTEVLLEAYIKWGEKCLDKLNGMFAFAIWDKRKQQLFAARDRFGEKPFYYYLDKETYFFSSEVKGIFATGLFNAEVNEQALAFYISREVLEGIPETLWQNIYRLPPAHFLVAKISDGRLQSQVKPYWNISQGEEFTGSRKDALERFRELFEDSIKLRLRADVEIGSCLSGGMDSSCVVRQIHQLGTKAGQTAFSARMEDPRLDEGEYIHAVLKGTQIKGYEVTPSGERLEEAFSKFCYHQEEPTSYTSMFAQYEVMQLAHDNNVVVILDGQGADELITGYNWYFQQYHYDLAKEKKLWSLLLESIYSTKRRKRRVSLKPHFDGFFGKKVPVEWGNRTRSGWWEWGEVSKISYQKECEVLGNSLLSQNLYRDSSCGQLQDLLRYSDRNSMAWSREIRQPFLDHRLAEFSYKIPSSLKIYRGESKWILRESMKEILPAKVYNRQDKKSFQPPLAKWLLGDLNAWTLEKLGEAKEELGDFLVPEAAELMKKSLVKGASEWAVIRELYNIMTLAESLKQVKNVALRSGVES